MRWIATFVLLVPVGAVMTLAWSQVYAGHTKQLHEEASGFAVTIAAHLEVAGPAADSSLRTFVELLPLPENSTVTVTDDKGVTQFSDPTPAERSAQTIERTTAMTKVRGRQWTVEVAIPYAVAYYRAIPNAQTTILISGLATLILLLMQAVFLRRWLPALSSLERSAAKVGAGDLSPPPSVAMPSRELEHLRDGFHDMVNRLRTAREAIAWQVEEERGMRLELESLQQQVIRQERLAAIGVLVGLADIDQDRASFDLFRRFGR